MLSRKLTGATRNCSDMRFERFYDFAWLLYEMQWVDFPVEIVNGLQATV